MNLFAIEGEVEARDGSGETRKAKIAQCPQCRSQGFIVFALEGHDHLHLQCIDCDTSYCPKGEPCSQPEEQNKTYDEQR